MSDISEGLSCGLILPFSLNKSPGPDVEEAKLNLHQNLQLFLFLFIFLNFIYLFMTDTEREREAETQAERSRLHAGSPTWDLIPGLQDHTLAKGSAKPLGHRGCPVNLIF